VTKVSQMCLLSELW